ncbi:substrate-binding domain-containing protein, partial [Nocardia brasiliensis]|uniref:molybdate ABC transporter substrate-binding protein n=1 Tax=Nocardia brasiliensis TaxID=37326 RepID=UPI003D793C7C
MVVYSFGASSALAEQINQGAPADVFASAAPKNMRQVQDKAEVTVVLLISGSTRSASTNSAALRTVQAIAPAEIETRWYDGLAELPA